MLMALFYTYWICQLYVNNKIAFSQTDHQNQQTNIPALDVEKVSKKWMKRIKDKEKDWLASLLFVLMTFPQKIEEKKNIKKGRKETVKYLSR